MWILGFRELCVETQEKSRNKDNGVGTCTMARQGIVIYHGLGWSFGTSSNFSWGNFATAVSIRGRCLDTI